jgi:putative acetyltransferase
MRSGTGLHDLSIRSERAGDHDAITAVVAAAFGSRAEARLVDAIRTSENYVPHWSLVAEAGGRVVGHVMASYVGLRDGATGVDRRVPSLSPLAVAPELHGRGIGSALVRELAARLDAGGEPLVVLEGAPAYYARFGFEPAAAHGIDITLPSWAPPDAAQVLPLRNDDPAIRGHVVYPPAFDPVVEH